MLPNLIIPGVQKCATSAIHTYLAAHSQCVMSAPKEPHFFTANWNRWTQREYENCFPVKKESDVRIWGEASTTYFEHREAPKRIRDVLGPDTKIVVLLRSPARRAVSAYWHMAKRFDERRNPEAVFGSLPESLDDALIAEESGVREAIRSGEIRTQRSLKLIGDRCRNFRYLRNSCYCDNLKRYEQTFGRRNTLVVLTEDLADRPVATFGRIANFLRIDEEFSGADLNCRINVTTLPKAGWMGRVVNSIAETLPGGPALALKNHVSALGRRLPPATPAHVRDRLDRLFRVHNQQLAKFLGRDLSVWRCSTPVMNYRRAC